MSAVAEATAPISMGAAMESFASMFEESLTRQELRAGEVITAEVVRIDQNFVVVNAGLKSESMIPVEEFHTDRGELARRVCRVRKPSVSRPGMILIRP